MLVGTDKTPVVRVPWCVLSLIPNHRASKMWVRARKHGTSEPLETIGLFNNVKDRVFLTKGLKEGEHVSFGFQLGALQ